MENQEQELLTISRNVGAAEGAQELALFAYHGSRTATFP